MSDTQLVTADEARFREVLMRHPWFGSWDEWSSAHYNHLPVCARAVMSHIYGLHNDTDIPYAHCVLCETFRVQPCSVDGCSTPALGSAPTCFGHTVDEVRP